MSLPRLNDATHIADRLNELAAIVKTRSRASLTDANHILETIAKRFFNALFDWDLVNLNTEQANYPAADLGDRHRRIAIQVTNTDGSKKIEHTAAKAMEHHLGKDFDRLIVFFLLQEKPGFPKKFVQPPNGPKVETLDIADLLKQMQEMSDLNALAKAADVLDQEMGKIAVLDTEPKFDISRILKYAPAQLIGREEETKLLNDAWAKTQNHDPKRPHVLTFVALGGEGKTSLVAKWAAELAAQDWPGCDAAFAWSFYSQGTRDQLAASSDLFLKEALTFFGDDADKAFAASPAGAFEKGQRLARLVGQRRSLLILDGLEPLQYAPTAPTPGELKDQGLAALLKGLATANQGLCVVTTRYSLPDLKAFWQTTAPEVKLLRLSRDAGVHLLKSFNVRGSDRKNIPFGNGRELLSEFEKLGEDVKGHALTLTLLGSYLRDAHEGDIRRRDLVKIEEADIEEGHGHAFHVMDAYVKWLEGSESRLQAESGGRKPAKAGTPNPGGHRALAILRLLGLFDRPMTADCFAALLKAPAIPGLTEPLMNLPDAKLNIALARLESAKLLTVNRDDSANPKSAIQNPKSLDAHPHLREYFARQLRTQQPDAWRAAHRRLYEHLCDTAPECTKFDERDLMMQRLGLGGEKDKPQPTLEDLQPLYQAVAHGCQAGLEEKACNNVFFPRIQKGKDKFDDTDRFGAFASNLACALCFFESRWSKIPSLKEYDRALLLNQIGQDLRAMGRLAEAEEPLDVAFKQFLELGEWRRVSQAGSNLLELYLLLGDLKEARELSCTMIKCADKSGDPFESLARRANYGDVMHQAGDCDKALNTFKEAEQMQAKRKGDCPLLHAFQGSQYCDLLLDGPERAAWQFLQKSKVRSQVSELIKECHRVSERAVQTFEWTKKNDRTILDRALDNLTLGRAALYEAILGNAKREHARHKLDAAVDNLRSASMQDHLPRGLLARAWLRFLNGKQTGPESAQEDLDEAWEIAERGPMKLFMADILLSRARLFGMRRSEVRGQRSGGRSIRGSRRRPIWPPPRN